MLTVVVVELGTRDDQPLAFLKPLYILATQGHQKDN